MKNHEIATHTLHHVADPGAPTAPLWVYKVIELV